MRLRLTAITFLLLSGALFAQTSRDDLMKGLAKDACAELGKVDLSKQTPDQLKMTMAMAFLGAASKHQTEMSALGLNLGQQADAQKLGVDIASHMLNECPATMLSAAKNPETLRQAAAQQANKTVPTGSITGTLRKVVGGDFSYLQVEDANGKIEKLWWMEYFDGSNTLVSSPATRLNKPVTVKYVEKEVFNSTLGDYVKIKIITGIE
jgi:hypothetical protein